MGWEFEDHYRVAVAQALKALFRWLGGRAPRPAEKPLRDELLSIERLEERARGLAARFTIDPNPRRQARNVLPRLEDNARVLREAYITLADDVHGGGSVAPAAEWLLDNYHLVASEVLDVRRNLPPSYFRELPKLALPELEGHARVYALAEEIVRHSDSRLDRQQLVRFISGFQAVAPLTIGELWAWPSMLKLALIENLRRLAEEMLEDRAAVRAADAYVARIDAAGHGQPPPLPTQLHTGYVHQLIERLREYGPRLAAVRAAVETHLSAQDTTPRTRSGASTSAKPPPRSPWRTSSPASGSAPRSTGDSTSRPSAWSRAYCSATRPGSTGKWTS